eukprot:2170058-Amphidinium_carterae.1
MDKDEIKDLERRATNKEDPEAERQYNWYMEENRKLEKNLREEYEKYHGAFEDKEDYQKALEDKDSETIKNIIFEYAASVRERKLQYMERLQGRRDEQAERGLEERSTTRTCSE